MGDIVRNTDPSHRQEYAKGAYPNDSLETSLAQVFGQGFADQSGLDSRKPSDVNGQFFEISKLFQNLPGRNKECFDPFQVMPRRSSRAKRREVEGPPRLSHRANGDA